MLRFGNKIFIQTEFCYEKEIEDVVNQNAEYLFGPSLVMLPKSKISTADRSDTIPDGFVIDFSTKRWYIIEAELASHDVWAHIAKQVSKQITASLQESTKEKLINLFFNLINEDELLQERIINEGIQIIQIHKVLSEIIKKEPVIGIPIDRVTADLKDYARTLRYECKLWEIKKFIETSNKNSIIYQFPDEFRPVFETGLEMGNGSNSISQYDVNLLMLIQAGFLVPDEIIKLCYKPSNGTKNIFEATISPLGNILIDGEQFETPSFAALYCIKKAGSSRSTVNGWTSWKNSKNKKLSELRDLFLKSKL